MGFYFEYFGCLETYFNDWMGLKDYGGIIKNYSKLLKKTKFLTL